MSAANGVKFSLKIMVNKKENKVIFAEVNSDFADILLSFLTMPLGKIVRVMEKYYGIKSPVIGSLTSLRKGLANLNSVHFCTEGGKQMLLNPISLFEDECHKMKLNVYDSQPTKYFTCGDWDCKKEGRHYVTMYYGTLKCNACGKTLHKETRIKGSSTGANNGDGGVFAVNTMSFLLSDDMQMMPNVPGAIFQTLSNLGFKDTDGAELRIVTFGLNEIMDLLKWSLLSETPLTDLILHKRQMDSTTGKTETRNLLHQIEKKATSNHNKKMIVKAMIQKSTNKLLLVQAKEDFVDFLFSLLTIPLGGAVGLLGSKTSLGSVDNLCKSIANLIVGVHLTNLDMKAGLHEPKLPAKFRSFHQMLSITEQIVPTLYYYREGWTEYLSYSSAEPCSVWFKDPKGEGSFVKRPGIFLVTDDLTVVPSSMDSSFSIVNGLKIPFADVKELDIDIGLEEALSILKASLTSTNALTNGLSSTLKKQPKQEQ